MQTRSKPTLEMKFKAVRTSSLKLKYYINIYNIAQNIKIYGKSIFFLALSFIRTDKTYISPY